MYMQKRKKNTTTCSVFSPFRMISRSTVHPAACRGSLAPHKQSKVKVTERNEVWDTHSDDSKGCPSGWIGQHYNSIKTTCTHRHHHLQKGYFYPLRICIMTKPGEHKHLSVLFSVLQKGAKGVKQTFNLAGRTNKKEWLSSFPILCEHQARPGRSAFDGLRTTPLSSANAHTFLTWKKRSHKNTVC